MRILIISDAWHPQVNGVVRTLSMLQHELTTLGHEVEVIGPDRFRTMAMPSYRSIQLAIAPSARLVPMIEAFQPEALHIATEGPLGWAARRWALRRGVAFTTSFHTRFPEYLHARARVPIALGYACLRRFHGRAHGTMVAAGSMRRELAGRGFRNLLPWSRGVDLDRFQPGAVEEWPFERPIFLYVGRLAVEKNLDQFLSLDLPGTKVVVGDGPQRAALQAAYPEARFVGERHGPALVRAYAGADVFVFPSLTDTFGLVLLESLACGTPIAAHPVTGPADILAGARPGVGSLDSDLRAAALRALEGDRAACRAHAERFSWRACAELFFHNLAKPAKPA
ncbi:MAG TPA: glycosyltransferase family 1 protein [Acetobacteraceae bacterium]|nr:glycosyltransferase family 1 protein [Acetobacteraceae bacterium]